IADNGSVCGWMGDGNESTAHGFIWNDGIVTDLGAILPGATGVDVRAINNRNGVCGFCVFDDPKIVYRRRACLWSEGQATDLGTLPGFVHSRAYALNDTNVVIGYCDNFPLRGEGSTA